MTHNLDRLRLPKAQAQLTLVLPKALLARLEQNTREAKELREALKELARAVRRLVRVESNQTKMR